MDKNIDAKLYAEKVLKKAYLNVVKTQPASSRFRKYGKAWKFKIMELSFYLEPE